MLTRLMALLAFLHGGASSFDLSKVPLTYMPSTPTVRKAVQVVQQINRAYQENCFVYTHNIDGINRLLQSVEGIGGVTRSLDAHFNISTTYRLTKKSRCAIFITPLPDTIQKLLDYDRSMWNISSTKKVILYILEEHDPGRAITLASYIPAINSTFSHILLRNNTKPKGDGTNDTIESVELLCLSNVPVVIVDNFAMCRDTILNLQGVTLSVSYYGSPPNIVFSNPISGSDIDVLNMFKQKFGFDYVLRKETTLDSGPGNTAGLTQRVGNGESDLGIGGALQTSDRTLQMYFLSYMYWNDIVFVTPAPSPVNVFYTVVLPFDGPIWACVGASLIGLIIGLQICDIVWKRSFEDARLKIDSLYHHCVIVFSSFMGLELPHTWLQHRIIWAKSLVLGVTFMAGFFINMDYKSTLRANLYIDEYSSSLDTADQIYRSGLPVVIVKGTVQQSLLQDSPRKILRQIYNASAKNGYIVTKPNGQYPRWTDKEIDSGKAVFLTAPALVALRNGSYHVASETIYGSISSYMVPKCSILPNIWNMYIMQLSASGIISKLYYKYLGANAGATARRGNFKLKTDDSPLNISQVMLIFLVLLAGLIMGAASFYFEMKKGRRQLAERRRRSTLISVIGADEPVWSHIGDEIEMNESKAHTPMPPPA